MEYLDKYPSLEEILKGLETQSTAEEPEKNEEEKEDKQEKGSKIDKVKDWFHGIFSYQRP